MVDPCPEDARAGEAQSPAQRSDTTLVALESDTPIEQNQIGSPSFYGSGNYEASFERSSMGSLSLGEFLDMAEDILDERPEAADFPIRVRGMVVTDLYLESWEKRDGTIELVAMLPHEVDDSD